jgi:FAD/FMN-containing dehydrogenase
MRACAIVLLLPLLGVSSATYCVPGDSCWPSAAQWAALNASVSGRLQTLVPVETPCYTEGSGSAACQFILNNWTNETWRTAQPAAMCEPNFEADPTTGANCYDPTAPCAQGSVPPMMIRVQNASDVAAGLTFATERDIRVVIKSSGHDYLGRSTAAGALLLWMHDFAGSIVVDEALVTCPGDAPEPAVHVPAGSNWGEVYTTLPAQWGVVGGSSRSVSACGGYTLGGGHSFMSPSRGLAVDNALGFQVVLANGTQVTASSCSHPDLFWALKGGGGGTFGVVTQCTYRLFPTPAEGVTGMVANLDLVQGGGNSTGAIWDVLLNFFPSLIFPSVNATTQTYGGVWGGYINVLPGTPYPTLSAAWVFNSTMDEAASSLAPFLAVIEANSPTLWNVTSYSLFPAASMNAWHDAIDPSDATGQFMALGSRLIPLTSCTDPTARTAAIEALSVVSEYVGVFGMMVAGGAVAAADPQSTLTSVTPAWRSAALHATLAISWDSTTSFAQEQQYFEDVSNLTSVLRAAAPASGAYLNEADFLEPDWQGAFWGEENYARLLGIKSAYDPGNVLTCRFCVGSQ